MTAQEAWRIYSKGFKDIKQTLKEIEDGTKVETEKFKQRKLEYGESIHRLRQATKEGYRLCRVDEVLGKIDEAIGKNVDKQAMAAEDNDTIILNECMQVQDALESCHEWIKRACEDIKEVAI